MDIMYLKNTNNEKKVIVKSGNIILKNSNTIDFNGISDSHKIIDFASRLKKNKNSLYSKNHIKKLNEDNINSEITIFFFNAIHKNHLLYQKDK